MSAEPSLATQPTATPNLLRRMTCWLYESLLMFGVAFVASFLFGVMNQQRHALSHRVGLMAFLFIVFGLYFTWFWSKGQTLAMKTWHIRMVSQASGQGISQSRALWRYVLSWVWLLPPLALAAVLNITGWSVALLITAWLLIYAMLSHLHPQKQFWHDAWAGTGLIDTRLMDKNLTHS